MINQAVILATGRGVRLGPLTKDRPKAMLPVLGKPIVVRLMDRMHEAGIKRFIVVVGEQEGAVASYLNGSWVPDAQIQIVLQPMARGTADALANAASYINGPFLVATSDNLISPSHIPALLRRFDDFGGEAVISLSPNPPSENTTCVSVRLDGSRVVEITDKPPKSRREASAFTLYACSERIIHYAEAARRAGGEMANAIQNGIAAGGKVSFVNAEWHLPLASDIDLLTINKRFLREGRDTHILSEIPGSVHIIPPVRIDPGVSIGQDAKIGPNVYVENGAHVGKGAILWDSMVLRNAAVEDGEVLHGQIVGRRERISEEQGVPSQTGGNPPTE